MGLTTIQIETGKGKKGRSFNATLLAWIDAPTFLQCDTTKGTERPVFVVYATSVQGHRPFTTNFLAGTVATGLGHRGTKYQILKTGGYGYHSRKTEEMVVTTVFCRSAFQTDPGMVDPEKIRFLLLQSAARYARAGAALDASLIANVAAFAERNRLAIPGWRWPEALTDREIVEARFREAERLRRAEELGIDQGDEDEDESVDEDDRGDDRPARLETILRPLLVEAALFWQYLDRRTRYPMITDTRFALQLMLRCLQEGVARQPQGGHSPQHRFLFEYEEHGLADVGLAPGIALATDHETFGKILAEEVTKWHA